MNSQLKNRNKIILTREDREEIEYWSLLENIIGTSEEVALVVAECKEFIEKNQIPIKKVKLGEAEVLTLEYRGAEDLGTENDSGTNSFVKRNYKALKKKFTIQRLQNILNWYHVFDPCLMLIPSPKLLVLVPDTLIQIVGQENWDYLLALIGGLYYLDALSGDEDARLTNTHKILYTKYRQETEREFLEYIDTQPEIQEKIRKGNFTLPYELNGIIKMGNLVSRYIPQGVPPRVQNLEEEENA